MSLAELRAAIDEYLGRGADFVKYGAAFVMAASVPASGCGSDIGGAAGGGAVIRTDSAGVQIAKIPAALLDHLPEWSLAAVPEMTIGRVEGEAAYLLGEILGATRLETGETVVLDAQAKELRVFDAAGTYLRTFGREGDGPGEFRYPSLVRALDGPRFAAYDRRHFAVTIWDVRSGLVSTERTSLSGCPVRGSQSAIIACTVHGILADGRFAVRYHPPRPAGARMALPPPGEAVNRDGLAVHVGVSDGGRIQIVDSIIGPPLTTILADRLVWQVPTLFRAYGQMLVGRDRIAVADNATFEIRSWDSSGAPREIARVSRAAMPVTPDRIEEIRSWAETARPTSIGTLLPVAEHLDGGELGDSVPHFGDALLDEAGRLWLADYGPSEEMRPVQRWHWTVIDRTGVPLARISTGRPHDLLEIGEDYVLVREIDEMHVGRVAMYRFEARS